MGIIPTPNPPLTPPRGLSQKLGKSDKKAPLGDFFDDLIPFPKKVESGGTIEWFFPVIFWGFDAPP